MSRTAFRALRFALRALVTDPVTSRTPTAAPVALELDDEDDDDGEHIGCTVCEARTAHPAQPSLDPYASEHAWR